MSEDLQALYEDYVRRKRQGFWLTSLEEIVYTLLQRIAVLEAENARLKAKLARQ